VTATVVRIKVKLLGGETNVGDVGTFSPGISIKHRVRNEQDQLITFPPFGGPRNRPECGIVWVKFGDGTTWTAADETVARRQAGAAPEDSHSPAPTRTLVGWYGVNSDTLQVGGGPGKTRRSATAHAR
jgi:hypothetical protein